MKIGEFDINEKVLIVAEIGNNHEGDFRLAKSMIDLALGSGADAVKFQTFKTERYVTSSDEKRTQQLRGFEFSYEAFAELAQYTKEQGGMFLTTPFDVESVDAVDDLVPAFKIASSDNTFYPLLERVIQKEKPIILSTGLLSCTELEKTVHFLREKTGEIDLSERVALLHCVSSYPAEPEQLNLRSIPFLKEQFKLVTGYSDHSQTITSCLAAVSMGARIIEKHFTYGKKDQLFRDHFLSADPKEFCEMVKGIRMIEKMLGSYHKEPCQQEDELRPLVRRSIAAKKALKKGHLMRADDLTWVRPASGILVGQEDLVLGHRVKKDIQVGELLSLENVE